MIVSTATLQRKVLWLCSTPIGDSDNGGSATWLGAIAKGLSSSGNLQLGVIALGRTKCVARADFGPIKQWIVPDRLKLNNDGLPPQGVVSEIVRAVDFFAPDLVHCWGTENFWSLLPVRGVIKYPALLEVQGLKGEIAKVYYGGLSRFEQICCTGLKEVLLRRLIWSERRRYLAWGRLEAEMISGFNYVGVQSPWVASKVCAIAPNKKIVRVERALRSPFYAAQGWRRPKNPVIFCSAAYASPGKGLHVAIRALALLHRRLPGVRLRIAGALQKSGIRQDGYIRWLNREIQRLNLSSSIEWLGPLSAEHLVSELESASLALIPTFVETYCVALAEAMVVGTPVVSSYTGGTAHLGRDEESCLFFPAGDEEMCAAQIARLLTDESLACRISTHARRIGLLRNSIEGVVNNQIRIYESVLKNE